jgi:hypothetical protein
MSEFAGQYDFTLRSNLTHRVIGLLPPCWRESAAEHFLRRDAPGPAYEHAVQYQLDAARHGRDLHQPKDAVITRGADSFYSRQYRQYFNATMGAFAMTATQAVVAAGGLARGRLWWRHRETFAAVLEEIEGAVPILVLDKEAVALALLLPRLVEAKECAAMERWLSRGGPMPETYRSLVTGQEVACSERNVVARERSNDGAILEVLDAARHTRKVAVLALHPYDPDAMASTSLCSVSI